MILMQETLLFQTALHRPVVESAEEPDDPEFRDAAHCRAAIHRPDVESAAEPLILSSKTLLIVEQLFTDLMQNQQQNQMSLI